MTLGDLGHLLPRHMWAYGVGHPDGSSLREDESRRSRESEAVDAAAAVGLGGVRAPPATAANEPSLNKLIYEAMLQ